MKNKQALIDFVESLDVFESHILIMDILTDFMYSNKKEIYDEFVQKIEMLINKTKAK